MSVNDQNSDPENDEDLTTLSIATRSVKQAIDALAQMLEDQTHQILGDLVEPVDTFTKHY